MGRDFAAVLFDDAVRDAESQSGSFAGIFSGEKWIEHPVRIRESAAIVAEAYTHATIVLVRFHGNASRFNSMQCIERIIQQIEKDLFEQVLIHQDSGKIF